MRTASAWGPWAVAEHDVADGSVSVRHAPDGAVGAFVLVRRGRRTVDLRWVIGDSWREAPADAPGSGTRPWDGHAADAADATVVVCTTGRSPMLPEVVGALLVQEPVVPEVVVVDNAPETGAVHAALAGVGDPRLTVVPEPTRGLSHARNRGLAATRTGIVAFTDDDAIPDAGWLAALVAPLRADAGGLVGGSTGMVVPDRLDLPSRVAFEARGGFVRPAETAVWRTGARRPPMSWGAEPDGGPLFPLTTARVGAGANMAFRRAVLEEIGGFDVDLGAGTALMGGEDLDAFARVLRTGLCIVYTPDAVVWHRHRSTQAELRAQVRGAGTGMGALVAKAAVRDPHAMGHVATRLPRVVARVLDRIRSSDGTMGAPDGGAARAAIVPGGLTRVEAVGFLRGFAGRLAIEWRRRRHGRRADLP